jgi:hypothetical protein
MRSRGSVEFAALGRTLKWWETELSTRGVKAALSTIGAWKTGDRSPPEGARNAIAAIATQLKKPVPPVWWDEPIPESAAALIAAVPVQPATPELVASEADELLAQIRTVRARLVNDPLGDPNIQARQLAQLAAAASQLGKLTAVGLVLSERQILSSPNWTRIEDAIVSALSPWPDAMRAVADSLNQLRGDTL